MVTSQFVPVVPGTHKPLKRQKFNFQWVLSKPISYKYMSKRLRMVVSM